MNSRRKQLDHDHRIATRQAAELDCVICGRPAPSMPCHYKHRGMGGGKAGWRRDEWWPGCGVCHSLIDRRAGVSKHIEAQRRLAIDTLIRVTVREDW